MNRYYIKHDDDGNNFDCLVDAESEEQAVVLWRRYYDNFYSVEPDTIWLLPPMSQKPRAIKWFIG